MKYLYPLNNDKATADIAHTFTMAFVLTGLYMEDGIGKHALVWGG